MKKAIIYIPNKNPMQSGLAKNNKWILEYKTEDPTKNPLMEIQVLILLMYLKNFPTPLKDF